MLTGQLSHVVGGDDFGTQFLSKSKPSSPEVAEVARVAYSAVAAEYRGISVEDDGIARCGAQSGVYLRVVKNTLARRAMKDTEFECMADGLTGPLVLAFSGRPGCGCS